MWSADPQAVKKLVFVASSNHRCRSRQIFGDAKDFCPNFPKLARKNYKGDLPKKSKKTSAFWFWAPFSSNQRTSNDSVKVVTPFCPDFHGFCPDFKGFCPDFHQINICGGALALLHTRLLHQCVKWQKRNSLKIRLQ